METVRLVGGPAHGRVVEWRGGESLLVALPPDPPVASYRPTAENVEELTMMTALYRRSDRTRHLFVHQP